MAWYESNGFNGLQELLSIVAREEEPTLNCVDNLISFYGNKFCGVQVDLETLVLTHNKIHKKQKTQKNTGTFDYIRQEINSSTLELASEVNSLSDTYNEINKDLSSLTEGRIQGRFVESLGPDAELAIWEDKTIRYLAEMVASTFMVLKPHKMNPQYLRAESYLGLLLNYICSLTDNPSVEMTVIRMREFALECRERYVNSSLLPKTRVHTILEHCPRKYLAQFSHWMKALPVPFSPTTKLKEWVNVFRPEEKSLKRSLKTIDNGIKCLDGLFRVSETVVTPRNTKWISDSGCFQRSSSMGGASSLVRAAVPFELVQDLKRASVNDILYGLSFIFDQLYKGLYAEIKDYIHTCPRDARACPHLHPPLLHTMVGGKGFKARHLTMLPYELSFLASTIQKVFTDFLRNTPVNAEGFQPHNSWLLSAQRTYSVLRKAGKKVGQKDVFIHSGDLRGCTDHYLKEVSQTACKNACRRYRLNVTDTENATIIDVVLGYFTIYMRELDMDFRKEPSAARAVQDALSYTNRESLLPDNDYKFKQLVGQHMGNPLSFPVMGSMHQSLYDLTYPCEKVRTLAQETMRVQSANKEANISQDYERSKWSFIRQAGRRIQNGKGRADFWLGIGDKGQIPLEHSDGEKFIFSYMEWNNALKRNKVNLDSLPYDCWQNVETLPTNMLAYLTQGTQEFPGLENRFGHLVKRTEKEKKAGDMKKFYSNNSVIKWMDQQMSDIVDKCSGFMMYKKNLLWLLRSYNQLPATAEVEINLISRTFCPKMTQEDESGQTEFKTINSKCNKFEFDEQTQRTTTTTQLKQSGQYDRNKPANDLSTATYQGSKHLWCVIHLIVKETIEVVDKRTILLNKQTTNGRLTPVIWRSDSEISNAKLNGELPPGIYDMRSMLYKRALEIEVDGKMTYGVLHTRQALGYAHGMGDDLEHMSLYRNKILEYRTAAVENFNQEFNDKADYLSLDGLVIAERLAYLDRHEDRLQPSIYVKVKQLITEQDRFSRDSWADRASSIRTQLLQEFTPLAGGEGHSYFKEFLFRVIENAEKILYFNNSSSMEYMIRKSLDPRLPLTLGGYGVWSGIPHPYSPFTLSYLRMLTYLCKYNKVTLPRIIKKVRQTSNRFRTTVTRTSSKSFYSPGPYRVLRKEYKEVYMRVYGYIDQLSMRINKSEVKLETVAGELKMWCRLYYSVVQTEARTRYGIDLDNLPIDIEYILIHIDDDEREISMDYTSLMRYHELKGHIDSIEERLSDQRTHKSQIAPIEHITDRPNIDHFYKSNIERMMRAALFHDSFKNGGRTSPRIGRSVVIDVLHEGDIPDYK